MMQARNLRVDEYDLSDYSKQVRIIVNEGRNFAKDLLALCGNLDEAKLLLSHDALLDSYSLTKEETKWDYKCLDEAVVSNHKEIVTQDFSQRIFRETWHNNEELTNPLPVPFLGLFLKFLTTVIFTPYYILLHLLFFMPCESFGKMKYLEKNWPRVYKGTFYYTIPRNRCLADIIAHLQMIALILVVMINPNDKQHQIDPDWYDIFLCLWTIGGLVKILRDIIFYFTALYQDHMMKKKKYKNRLYQCLKSDFLQLSGYKTLVFICCFFILLGQILKAKGFENCMVETGTSGVIERLIQLVMRSFIPKDCQKDNPSEYCDKSLLKTSYALIGAGSTLCILTLLPWLELNSYLGPVLIALRSTIGDILKILTTFLFFLFAFSVGLHFSLKYSNMYCEDELNKIAARRFLNESYYCEGPEISTNISGFTLEDNVNHFRFFVESIKTCFWSLFDPGHPEVIGCTQVTFTDFSTYLLYSKI